MELFAEQGYDSTTVEQIAAAFDHIGGDWFSSDRRDLPPASGRRRLEPRAP
ncbi:TetR family transcriptional regulator [Kineosporia mesophila]|uniref:TetR family transcriptional regulator n=1 Tax=Kineosporia mesophila TaxID=566012 RepID=UPI003CD06EFF